MINGFLLLGSFFVARLVYGSYVVRLRRGTPIRCLIGNKSYHFARTMYELWGTIPVHHFFIYGTSNVLLNALNWFWYVCHVPPTLLASHGAIVQVQQNDFRHALACLWG